MEITSVRQSIEFECTEERVITWMIEVYGFYEECMRRYPNCPRMWTVFQVCLFNGIDEMTESQDVFGWMPITALVSERILCMHGGISPKLESLQQLR